MFDLFDFDLCLFCCVSLSIIVLCLIVLLFGILEVNFEANPCCTKSCVSWTTYKKVENLRNWITLQFYIG